MDISEDPDKLAESLMKRGANLKYQYPHVVDNIEGLIRELEKEVSELNQSLSELPDDPRKVFTLLLINEIHRSSERILLDDIN